MRPQRQSRLSLGSTTKANGAAVDFTFEPTSLLAAVGPALEGWKLLGSRALRGDLTLSLALETGTLLSAVDPLLGRAVPTVTLVLALVGQSLPVVTPLVPLEAALGECMPLLLVVFTACKRGHAPPDVVATFWHDVSRSRVAIDTMHL